MIFVQRNNVYIILKTFNGNYDLWLSHDPFLLCNPFIDANILLQINILNIITI